MNCPKTQIVQTKDIILERQNKDIVMHGNLSESIKKKG